MPGLSRWSLDLGTPPSLASLSTTSYVIHPSAWKGFSPKSISSIARISHPIATPGLHPLRPTVPSTAADHKRSEPTSLNTMAQ